MSKARRLTIPIFEYACGRLAHALVLSCIAAITASNAAPALVDPVDWQWDLKVPLRDGVRLSAILYRPRDQRESLPGIVTLTPYNAASSHERGVYFATHGYVFLSVDVRGRGNSEGSFRPLIQEARDGSDVVEWVAKQPYCNGKVGMWGGSYAGYDQWAAAGQRPPHLATIVPAAAAAPGVDFPGANNIVYSFMMPWLAAVSGRTMQGALLADQNFWASKYRAHYAAHRPFAELDRSVGLPSKFFQEWLAHPRVDAYWDAYNPTREQYARIDMPVLTITGHYDDDQSGALAHYRSHLAAANAATRERHYLIIGPWDHGQTRTPADDVGGLKLGRASMLDLNDLHRQWYDWTMKSGSRPEFLRERVAYYVTGAEVWRYADSLDAVTTSRWPLHLTSEHGEANDVFRSGALRDQAAGDSAPDQYVYDPLDVSAAELQTQVPMWDLRDQREILLAGGARLIYHSAPLTQDTEISGFFRLNAWIEIDQPDTDFLVQIYEIAADGTSLLLSDTRMRARYRESTREERLVPAGEVLEYRFDAFPFVARRLAKGSRLRLAIGPLNSIYWQKNYNSGGVVAKESAAQARTVTVRLHHDAQRQSILYVPIGTTTQ